MNYQEEARNAIHEAREALRRGDRRSARRWAEQAAALAPQLEEPWLLLAALASPQGSVAYVRRALRINPDSPRAQEGMRWALKRLGETKPLAAPARRTAAPAAATGSARGLARRRSSFSLPLLIAGLALVLWAVWPGSVSPAMASLLEAPAATPTIDSPQAWAQAGDLKPTYTPTPTLTPTPTPTFTPTPTPTLTPTPTDTPLPTDTPEPTSTPEPLPTEAPAAAAPAPVAGGVHWIDVDLSAQRVYAYEGDTLVNSFVVSTGTWRYPTVTGKYYIYVKLRYTDMAGPGYYLPDVPYTMYFYKGYALHGTYWHSNFGTPMSHGCINLRTSDAAWLFDFASVGTLVNIHD